MRRTIRKLIYIVHNDTYAKQTQNNIMPFDSITAREAGKISSRKGSPNRELASLRKRIEILLEDQFEQFLNDLNDLLPKERIDTYVKLLEYAIPKLQRKEATIDLSKMSDDEVEILVDRIRNNFEDIGYFFTENT